jgi:hypothetical protein
MTHDTSNAVCNVVVPLLCCLICKSSITQPRICFYYLKVQSAVRVVAPGGGMGVGGGGGARG